MGGCASASVTNKVYLDISIGGKASGRVIIKLFDHIVPKTAENFRELCLSKKYQSVIFHRIIPGFMCQVFLCVFHVCVRYVWCSGSPNISFFIVIRIPILQFRYRILSVRTLNHVTEFLITFFPDLRSTFFLREATTNSEMGREEPQYTEQNLPTNHLQ